MIYVFICSSVFSFLIICCKAFSLFLLPEIIYVFNAFLELLFFTLLLIPLFKNLYIFFSSTNIFDVVPSLPSLSGSFSFTVRFVILS